MTWRPFWPTCSWVALKDFRPRVAATHRFFRAKYRDSSRATTRQLMERKSQVSTWPSCLSYFFLLYMKPTKVRKLFSCPMLLFPLSLSAGTLRLRLYRNNMSCAVFYTTLKLVLGVGCRYNYSRRPTCWKVIMLWVMCYYLPFCWAALKGCPTRLAATHLFIGIIIRPIENRGDSNDSWWKGSR